jgi:hypothetical protein
MEVPKAAAKKPRIDKVMSIREEQAKNSLLKQPIYQMHTRNKNTFTPHKTTMYYISTPIFPASNIFPWSTAADIQSVGHKPK